MFESPAFYLLFGAGLLQGPIGLLNTGIIGGLVYLHSRRTGKSGSNFYDRAFLLGLLVLYMAIAGSAIASIPAVGQLLQSASGMYIAGEVPERLSGVAYSVLALCFVLGGRIIVDAAKSHYVGPGSNILRAPPIVPVVLLLTAIGLVHSSIYLDLMRRDVGFFADNCQSFQVISLPRDLSRLSLDDEPTLFLSLGHFLYDRAR